MRTIWKFTVRPDGGSIEMPVGAEILSTAFQGEELRLWAEVSDEPEVMRERRRFEVYGTGHEIPREPGYSSGRKFIGTAFHPAGLVFHVFERR